MYSNGYWQTVKEEKPEKTSKNPKQQRKRVFMRAEEAAEEDHC